MKYPGIPTTYNGVRFRSRLEARWAVMFDLLGWPWDYEPFDAAGYIPDFVLAFDRVYVVEVKPFVSFDDAGWNDAKQKMINSGITDRCLVLGAKIFLAPYTLDLYTLGKIYHSEINPYRICVAHRCSAPGCNLISPSSECERFIDHITGANEENEEIRYETITRLWKESGNTVQWKGRA